MPKGARLDIAVCERVAELLATTTLSHDQITEMVGLTDAKTVDKINRGTHWSRKTGIPIRGEMKKVYRCKDCGGRLVSKRCVLCSIRRGGRS